MIQTCLVWGLRVIINLGVSMDAFLQDLAQIFNHPPRPHRGTRLSADGGLKHQVEE